MQLQGLQGVVTQLLPNDPQQFLFLHHFVVLSGIGFRGSASSVVLVLPGRGMTSPGRNARVVVIMDVFFPGPFLRVRVIIRPGRL